MNVQASVERLLDVGGRTPVRIAYDVAPARRRAVLAASVLVTPHATVLPNPPRLRLCCPTCGAPQ
ncbi:hypothetical protein [Gemmatimonas sp.]